MKRNTFLASLVVAAFLVRLAAVLALRDINTPPTERSFGPDATDYDLLARQVARGNGYCFEPGKPTVYRPPGFPLYLAAIYRSGLPAYPAAYVSFGVLGALTCLLTYLLARELFSERAARLAAILNAVYFPHIYFATLYASENLFIFCLALGVWLFIRHQRTGSLAALAISGVVLGWGTLTRPYGILLLPFLVIVLLWSQWRRPGVRWSALALLVVCFLGPSAAWTARNHAVTGKVWFVATTGGGTFYQGNNPNVIRDVFRWGAPSSIVKLPERQKALASKPDDVTRDRMDLQLALEWLRDNPGKIPLLLVAKFIRLWLPSLFSPNKQYVMMNLMGYTPFLLLIVVGAFHCFRRKRYWTPPWLAVHGTLMATIVLTLIFFGSPRFRDANTPVLMLYAVVGARVFLGRAIERVPWLGNPRVEGG
jgi:4-amino-4-deoxy-L-arabinose transferase-like glycosyltransferase